jgi:hypothetical protein
LREYVLSLDENAVLKLANEAFEKGWDPHAVGAGILGPYYESKGIVFTMEKKLAILKDPQMHPEFRGYVASWGMKDRSLDLEAFLTYVDEVLAFFEDGTIDYFWKQGIPGNLHEALGRKTVDIQKQSENDGNKLQAMDKVYARGCRMMSDLGSYLENNPIPSKNRKSYSASSFAAASLSRYIEWYLGGEVLRTPEAENRLDAVRKAQRTLISILENSEYDPVAAHTVLLSAKESRLEQVLSADVVAKIKKDNRFSSDEDQRLLDTLNQWKNKVGTKGAQHLTNELK